MSNREKAKAYLSMMDEFHSAEDEEDALVGLLDTNDADLVELCGNAASSAAHDAGAYWVETAVYDACISVLK